MLLHILLWVLLALVLLVALILLMPVSIAVVYRKMFSLRLFLFGIPVFKTGKKEKQPKHKKTSELRKQLKKNPKKPKDNLWKTVQNQLGFKKAIGAFLNLGKILLKRLATLLRHFRFRNITFALDYAADDATKTAIHYGILCSTIYPFFSTLFSLTDCKVKIIDISADFNHTESRVRFSFAAKTRFFFLLIAFLSGYRAYKKWRSELHE